MLVLVLSVLVLLAVGGCVCVVWTARGDAPRWARGVAAATRLGGEAARRAGGITSGRKGSSSGDD